MEGPVAFLARMKRNIHVVECAAGRCRSCECENEVTLYNDGVIECFLNTNCMDCRKWGLRVGLRLRDRNGFLDKLMSGDLVMMS
jgi:hypothetical protein